MARLEIGQAAPDFSVEAVDGSTVNLADYTGDHTLLSFFRYAGCPFCDLTMIKLAERYQNFAVRGLKVVAFFESSKDTVEDYIRIKKPPFTVVADPDKKIYDLYGIESSRKGLATTLPAVPEVALKMLQGKVVKQGEITGDPFLMPAQFIVNPDLKLEKVHYGTNFADKLPFIEIESVLLTEVPHDHA